MYLMDQTLSQEQGKNNKNEHFPEVKENKIHMNNQSKIKEDVSRKLTADQHYITEKNFASQSFQNPEIYQARHSITNKGFENFRSYSDKNNTSQNHRGNFNLKQKLKNDGTGNLKETPINTAYSYTYSASTSAYNDGMVGDERYLDKPRKKLEKECYIIGSHKSNHDQNQTKKIEYQNRVYDIVKGSSYICQPVSNNDTVRINDCVIKDNIIMRCVPRNAKPFHTELNHKEYRSGNICSNTQTKTEEELKEDMILDERNDCTESRFHESQHCKDKGDFIRHDSSHFKASLLLHRHKPTVHLDTLESSEMKRKIRCAKVSKTFKSCLWALFFISIFLVIIGLFLLLHILTHFLRKNYINIVIEHKGFVTWVWIAMILSILLIVVGIFGIITSINRGKRILIAYCSCAFILSFLILVFLVFLWVLFVNMKGVKYRSMQNTLYTYRCDIHIRNAWNDLQRNHKCCGIEDQGDWRFIPPSCCNGTTKQEKIACIAYYISEKQAFNHGCKTKLEEYFFIFFIIAACLLLLGFLLLIFTIFVSLWLLGRYKKVEKCQEVYYISR